jgi:hypothetical protein
MKRQKLTIPRNRSATQAKTQRKTLDGTRMSSAVVDLNSAGFFIAKPFTEYTEAANEWLFSAIRSRKLILWKPIRACRVFILQSVHLGKSCWRKYDHRK